MPAPVDVLIVDDDTLVVSALRRLLNAHEFSVRMCEDSATALAAIEERMPAVIVLDIAMPGPTGIDLLTTIRARGWHVPVVLLTGLAVADAPKLAARHRVFRWLRKPASSAELLAAVRDAIASAAPLGN